MRKAALMDYEHLTLEDIKSCPDPGAGFGQYTLYCDVRTAMDETPITGMARLITPSEGESVHIDLAIPEEEESDLKIEVTAVYCHRKVNSFATEN
ncbi:MAG: hypothetical protein Q4B16_09065 [Bacteroidia bacterium]|nr:hypothetical protein [Bacteroidia bacterium]